MAVKVNLDLLKKYLLGRGWRICEASGYWMAPDGRLWVVGTDGLLTKLG